MSQDRGGGCLWRGLTSSPRPQLRICFGQFEILGIGAREAPCSANALQPRMQLMNSTKRDLRVQGTMPQQRMHLTASCSGRCPPDVQLSTCRAAHPQLWSKNGFPRCKSGGRRRNFRRECRAALPELFDPVTASRSVLSFSRVLASSSPAQLRPVIQTLGSDLAGVVSLKPTLSGAGHLAVCGPQAASGIRLEARCRREVWPSVLPVHNQSLG